MADDKTEYQIKDRLIFQRFLGLQLCDTVPDANTILHFREELNNANILDTVFCWFMEQLEKKGIITRSGSIVDATFVNVSRQYKDSAYTGTVVDEKGYKNRPLTKTQKRNNTAKSRIQVMVEHIFAAINHFGGICIRTIGGKRAEFQIVFMNLIYNMTRYVYLMEAKA